MATRRRSPSDRLPRATVVHCDIQYGHVSVALDDPLQPIPNLPEDRDPTYRRIHQFYDRWNTAALRLMENSFDNAHFSFVHRGTFGQQDQPEPERCELIERPDGLRAETTTITISNPPVAHRVGGSTEPTTRRHMRNAWFMPFRRRLD
jgi:phenylpropionate dioxygenase-like ring-hydroxylating dioxygenase large terminal subunit